MSDLVPEAMRRHWQAMSRRPQPRNVKAVSAARARDQLDDGMVVSFVGETCLTGPHVYVDSGQRYDWRFSVGLHATLVMRPGIDARSVMADLFLLHREAYPTLIDFDRQVVASVVDDGQTGGLKLWPRRRGSDAWQALFG